MNPTETGIFCAHTAMFSSAGQYSIETIFVSEYYFLILFLHFFGTSFAIFDNLVETKNQVVFTSDFSFLHFSDLFVEMT